MTVGGRAFHTITRFAEKHALMKHLRLYACPRIAVEGDDRRNKLSAVADELARPAASRNRDAQCDKLATELS